MTIRYDKYKDSGVEWIGEIPSHWSTIKVKYLAKENVQYGLNIGSENYVENGVRFLRTTDIDDYGKIQDEGVFLSNDAVDACYILKEGDFLISRSGTIGRAYVHGKQKVKYSYAGYLVRFVFGYFTYAKYLFYITKSESFAQWLASMSVESTIGNVNGQKYANFQFMLPSKEETETILHFLDAKTSKIDMLIEAKRRQIELLKEQRTAVINHAVTKGLDPNVEMKDSGVYWLGEIPKHWGVKKLKYLLVGKLKYGANESAESDDKSMPRYIRITDFGENGVLKDETFRSLPMGIAKEYLLNEGDILFARSGATVGKTFQFKNYNGVACFAGYLIKASPDSQICLSDFLYYFTKSLLYENWKNSVFIQATIQNIGADKYQNLMVVLPPIEEQYKITNYIESELSKIGKIISKAEKQIELLTEYRTALISEAVTGKIDVRREC